jgi:hypothetical protein
MMLSPSPIHDTSAYPLLPVDPSEATIQAELYHQARLAGLRVALELVIVLPTYMAKYPPARTKLRADLALFHGGLVVGLVEVKKPLPPEGLMDKRGEVRQREAYDSTGLSWVYCRGLGEIPDTLRWLATLANVTNRVRYNPDNRSRR